MIQDWLLRVGDGKNFENSSRLSIWGIKSTNSFGKYFMKNVKNGDRLWFVKSESNGKLIAVSTFSSHNTRESNNTNEKLGWTGSGVDWTSDTEIHYTDLYCLNDVELLSYIKGSCTIRMYNEKCKVELAKEYVNIVKYCGIIRG